MDELEKRSAARKRDAEREGMAAARKRAKRDMEEAHACGFHDDAPREGCPECDHKRNRAGH